MITKYLIITTFRTGGTTLCNLIQKKTGFADHGEYLLEHGPRTPSISFVKDVNLKILEKIDNLNNTDKWIVRLITLPAFLPTTFIQQAVVDPSTEVIFLYRRNIEDQFKSELNFLFRNTLQNKPQAHFKNNDPFIEYDKITLSETSMTQFAILFISRLQAWRLLYDLYGRQCKLVCFEDHIKNFNLSHIGIHEYNSDYIPTPYNTTKLTNGKWQDYVDLLHYYKHNVDL